MEITEVRIKLMDEPNDRLQAFCSITFDSCFVIRDLKIIQGTRGPFVAMPSRKLTDRCGKCGGKNELRGRFCCQCGARLGDDRAARDTAGRARLYADIAHPINQDCRELIQASVIEAFETEKLLAQKPDYVCHYDDYGEDQFAAMAEPIETIPFVPDPAREPSTPQTIAFPAADGITRRVDPAASRPANSPHPGGSRQNSRVGLTEDNDDFGFGV